MPEDGKKTQEGYEAASQEAPKEKAEPVVLNPDMPTNLSEALGKNKDWGEQFCR